MAPTVMLEYAKEKKSAKTSQNLTLTMMGKVQRSSRAHSAGYVPEYHHTVETVDESEGFGSSGRADSEDSTTPKRKCIMLNADNTNRFNIPVQVISLSRMSSSEGRDLKTKLREELLEVQKLQKKILLMNSNGVALSSSADGLGRKHMNEPRAAPQLMNGMLGKPEPIKRIQPTPAANNSTIILLMKQCETLLKRTMSHQYAWVFNEPVNVVKLNLPDYFSIIKHPMDLGTVKSKLASGAYSNPSGFLSDVRLTFTNAKTYNPPGNNVHKMADTLSKYFESRWKTIEKKLPATDSFITTEKEPTKLMSQSKKRKTPPTDSTIEFPKIAKNMKKIMTAEERANLSRGLDAHIGELPDHMLEFLRKCSGDVISEDEIEIDLNVIEDDVLFELQNLLDDFLKAKNSAHRMKVERHEMEILNESGIRNSSVHPCKADELAEEDVDIGGNDPPISNYPPVEIEKDTAARNNRCSSSGSSSSDSSSSSSDSDSASSSGSESDVKNSFAAHTLKECTGQKADLEADKSDILNPLGGNRFHDESDKPEQDAHSKSASFIGNGDPEGMNAPSGRQVSPEKLYRAALMRGRFADTIMKAQEKKLETEKGDPEKVQREREKLERMQKEEKARLQAEAKAAEVARKQAEAKAAEEAKRKRKIEREAARQALLEMEKTVEINENSRFLKDLEMLGTVPDEQLPSSLDEAGPDLSQDGIGGFKLMGSNPLEQLGLYMKVDYEEEEDIELQSVSPKDAEDGEID